MNDNDLAEKDLKAVQYLGKAYIKIPWPILNRMLDIRQRERRIGLVHLALFANCNYADSTFVVNGNMKFSGIGEVVSTYDKLAESVGLSVTAFRRCVKSLKDAGLIDVRRAGEATCFRVFGYEKFMRNMETRSFAGYQEKKNRSAEKLKEEELRRFGDQKPRTDLLD